MAGEGRRVEVYPPIHKLGVAGKWLRRQFMSGILAGTPVLLAIEKKRTGLLNQFMTLVSLMGEEEFYTLVFPVIAWVCDARLGRLGALLMAISFYVTGFLKNSLCLPRPPSPPVAPLHKGQDWSFPSHHAVLSTSLPWYLWFYVAFHYSYIKHTHVGLALFTVIALWSFCVMFSRIYLGVHSPADVLSGGVVGCLLLAMWLQYDMVMDHFLRHSSTSILLYFPAAVMLLYVHPDPKPASIIYKDSVTLVGVFGGVILTYLLCPIPIPALLEASQNMSVWQIVLCSVARYLLGVALLLLVKIIANAVLKELLKQLCHLMGVVNVVCHKRVSELKGDKIHYSPHFIALDKPLPESVVSAEGSTLDIAMPVRLLSYIFISAMVFCGSPYVFSILGI